jgi:hypothetical protein
VEAALGVRQRKERKRDAMHPALWGGFTWRITGKDARGKITKEGGWQNNRGSDAHPKVRFVENICEAVHPGVS